MLFIIKYVITENEAIFNLRKKKTYVTREDFYAEKRAIDLKH